MRKLTVFLSVFVGLSLNSFGQFHTLNMPQSSNKVKESQRLGVTTITIDYHSPQVKGRDVWNNPNVIPQNSDPIPWRAGANMNTTISFDTDVLIDGNPLAAGAYGLHVIPREGEYELLFAHSNQLWGSYYLDIEKDISLQVSVSDTICPFSEKLDFEFYSAGENAMIIGLEWADKRLPFEVAVDLSKTVVASFRKELRGINTYRWEAWNDAAKWCLDHDTNLEEALQWAERSMEGGYNGFAANKNLNNLSTKAKILKKLKREEEAKQTISEAGNIRFSANEATHFTRFLLDSDLLEEAATFSGQALEVYPDTWFILLDHGISKYVTGDKKMAIKLLTKSVEGSPERFQSRMKEIIEEVKEDTYRLPGK